MINYPLFVVVMIFFRRCKIYFARTHSDIKLNIHNQEFRSTDPFESKRLNSSNKHKRQIDARSTTTYDREQLNAAVVEKWEKGWQRETTFLASL